MTKFTWEHIHLRSPDPEATAAWYKDKFGAEVVKSPQAEYIFLIAPRLTRELCNPHPWQRMTSAVLDRASVFSFT
jgi:catechol 2,3-dioxygenase-like lactoylglutathione lyase family enzyme